MNTKWAGAILLFCLVACGCSALTSGGGDERSGHLDTLERLIAEDHPTDAMLDAPCSFRCPLAAYGPRIGTVYLYEDPKRFMLLQRAEEIAEEIAKVRQQIAEGKVRRADVPAVARRLVDAHIKRIWVLADVREGQACVRAVEGYTRLWIWAKIARGGELQAADHIEVRRDRERIVGAAHLLARKGKPVEAAKIAGDMLRGQWGRTDELPLSVLLQVAEIYDQAWQATDSPRWLSSAIWFYDSCQPNQRSWLIAQRLKVLGLAWQAVEQRANR